MKKVTLQSPAPDANIAAARLAKTLNNPVNLGIGTLPGHSYHPIEADTFTKGRKFLLEFLGLKDENISLIPTKGGGSGAISTGISALKGLGYQPQTISFSAWDWTGYDSFCYTHGLEKAYLSSNEYSSKDPDTLMMVQTNRNGDGTRLSLEQAECIIEENNRLERPSFIDLPYFTGEASEIEILQLFQRTAQTPTIIAWSPTKIFQTFDARPGGVTFVLFPSSEEFDKHSWIQSITARGTTGFDDAVTRELWEELANNPEGLKQRHQHYLNTIKTATALWRDRAPKEAATYFLPEDYGGMFRLFPAHEDTQARLAAENIVAVLMEQDDTYCIRVNLCGVVDAETQPITRAEDTIKTFFSILYS